MLDTLLQIGKTLRESGRLRHHRYIKRAPQNDKKTPVVYFSLPVREDFSFDLEDISKIEDEDFITHELFYLTYKTSDADSSIKYLWGDIVYGVDKEGKELGTYRIDEKKNAFLRAVKDEKSFVGTAINEFRKSFSENRPIIEKLLGENSQEQTCYLHFSFQEKHWYQFENEFKAVNEKMLNEFLGKQKGKYVLRKSLYKTLASPEKNLPFPNFTEDGIYKTKIFETADEVMDLLYSINYSVKELLRVSDIKIIVLPKGNNLRADQIEEFFDQRSNEKKSTTSKLINQSIAEEKLKAVKSATIDEFFDNLVPKILFEIGENIHSFDFIFSKAGGLSSPDVDMVELSGLRKSHLREIGERIAEIKQRVEEKRKKFLQNQKELFPFDIYRSFLNILGDAKIKNKQQTFYSKGVHLKGHLLKVLPQIYSGTYQRDDLLLTAFIERCEFNIRSENRNFDFLKFDYEFLTLLRQNGETEMENMKDSKSYQAGKLLGQLAQPVSWEIKSFEKNYVGLLSRRISDKQGLIGFANFINEKLAIHERAYPSLKGKYIELAKLLSEVGDVEYHRDYCAFGFFEGYFAKFEKPEKLSETTETPINLEEKI